MFHYPRISITPTDMNIVIEATAKIVGKEGKCEYCGLDAMLEPDILKHKNFIRRMLGATEIYDACYDCRSHFAVTEIEPATESDEGRTDVGCVCAGH